MLAVLVVAEWSYQSWGERVLPVSVAEPFYFREWVDLHSGEYFGSVVEYLRSLLDAEGLRMTAEEAARVRARFKAAVDLEKTFFDTCYNEPAKEEL
jgi:thiaminase/transcriptional activator TenA